MVSVIACPFPWPGHLAAASSGSAGVKVARDAVFVNSFGAWRQASASLASAKAMLRDRRHTRLHRYRMPEVKDELQVGGIHLWRFPSLHHHEAASLMRPLRRRLVGAAGAGGVIS
jgi:hypothetical protein